MRFGCLLFLLGTSWLSPICQFTVLLYFPFICTCEQFCFWIFFSDLLAFLINFWPTCEARMHCTITGMLPILCSWGEIETSATGLLHWIWIGLFNFSMICSSGPLFLIFYFSFPTEVSGWFECLLPVWSCFSKFFVSATVIFVLLIPQLLVATLTNASSVV